MINNNPQQSTPISTGIPPQFRYPLPPVEPPKPIWKRILAAAWLPTLLTFFFIVALILFSKTRNEIQGLQDYAEDQLKTVADEQAQLSDDLGEVLAILSTQTADSTSDGDSSAGNIVPALQFAVDTLQIGESIQIVAVLQDGQGNPLTEGTQVDFSVDRGLLISEAVPEGVTNLLVPSQSGKARVTFQAGPDAGMVNITAQAAEYAPVSWQIEILPPAQEPLSFDLMLKPDSLPGIFDLEHTAILTITLRDGENPVPDQYITFRSEPAGYLNFDPPAISSETASMTVTVSVAELITITEETPVIIYAETEAASPGQVQLNLTLPLVEYALVDKTNLYAWDLDANLPPDQLNNSQAVILDVPQDAIIFAPANLPDEPNALVPATIEVWIRSGSGIVNEDASRLTVVQQDFQAFFGKNAPNTPKDFGGRAGDYPILSWKPGPGYETAWYLVRLQGLMLRASISEP